MKIRAYFLRDLWSRCKKKLDWPKATSAFKWSKKNESNVNKMVICVWSMKMTTMTKHLLISGRCRSQICRWAIRSLLAMCIIRHSKHFNTLSVIFHILSWSTSRWWGLVMRSNYSIWRENRVPDWHATGPPHWAPLQLSPSSAQPFTVIHSDPPPPCIRIGVQKDNLVFEPNSSFLNVYKGSVRLG